MDSSRTCTRRRDVLYCTSIMYAKVFDVQCRECPWMTRVGLLQAMWRMHKAHACGSSFWVLQTGDDDPPQLPVLLRTMTLAGQGTPTALAHTSCCPKVCWAGNASEAGVGMLMRRTQVILCCAKNVLRNVRELMRKSVCTDMIAVCMPSRA